MKFIRLVCCLLVFALLVCSCGMVGLAHDGVVLSESEKQAIMESVRDRQYTLDELGQLMSLDSDLCSDILGWLTEVSVDLSLSDELSGPDASVYGGLPPYTIVRPDVDSRYRCICKIFMYSEDGGYYAGSASLVGSSVIMTAAHNVFNINDDIDSWKYGTFIKSMMVIPSYYCAPYVDNDTGETRYVVTYPCGYAWGDIDKAYVTQEWQSICDGYGEMYADNDFALVPLRNKTSNFVDDSFRKIKSVDRANDISNSVYLQVIGYPGDMSISGLNLLGCPSGYEKSEDCGSYRIDFAPYEGMSGGPVFDNDGFLVGIISGYNTVEIAGIVLDKWGIICGLTDDFVSILREYSSGMYFDRSTDTWKHV